MQKQPQHTHNEHPWEHPEIRNSSAGQYVIGYIATTVLMGIGCLLVTRHLLTPIELFFSLCKITMITIVTQLTLLFHLDFSETQIWNTFTLALNVPLLILSIGLTSWMFQELYDHVMNMPDTPLTSHAPHMTMENMGSP